MSKESARRFARWAFVEYVAGRERAYMVEAAIGDLETVFGDHLAAGLAREALSEHCETHRLSIMDRAIKALG